MAKSRRRVGVDPFTEDAEDLELVDLDDEEMEKQIMAKETAKKKARRAAEAEAVEDDDEDEEEVEDEAEVDDEDDEESEDDDEEGEDDEDSEDEEDESDPDAFIPWIYHEDAEWDLQEALDSVEKGDPVIVYDVKNNRWYKLQPIKVGEVPATEVEVTP